MFVSIQTPAPTLCSRLFFQFSFPPADPGAIFGNNVITVFGAVSGSISFQGTYDVFPFLCNCQMQSSEIMVLHNVSTHTMSHCAMALLHKSR